MGHISSLKFFALTVALSILLLFASALFLPSITTLWSQKGGFASPLIIPSAHKIGFPFAFYAFYQSFTIIYGYSWYSAFADFVVWFFVAAVVVYLVSLKSKKIVKSFII